MLNKYVISAGVIVVILGYAWYNHVTIRTLRDSLVEEQKISESLRSKIEVEKNLNAFIRQIRNKQSVEIEELERLDDNEVKEHLNTIIRAFNGV